MIGYRFLSPAEEEVTEAALFYDRASVGLGQDFLDDVQKFIDRLREYPQLGAEIGTGLRRVLLQRFPFSLIYAVETDQILIVSVAHQGRKPDYWRSRVGR